MQKDNLIDMNGFKQIDNIIEERESDIVEAVQKIVKIRSILNEPKEGMPFGEEISTALEQTLIIGQNLGFNTKNLDGYVGIVEYGTTEEYISVLGHLDIVDEGSGWEFPPYEAVIKDGKIWGRGTIDNKGPIIASLFALNAIKSSGIELKRMVRIILGTDEESNSRDIEYYNRHFSKPFKGFTPDANFPAIYGEKGILNLEITGNYQSLNAEILNLSGGISLNSVPSEAKANLINGEIRMLGKNAHGSTPELGENAITKLLDKLSKRWNKETDQVKKLETIKKYFTSDTDGSSLGINIQNEDEGNLTLNLGLINISDGKISLGLDIRYPSNGNHEEILTKIKKICDEEKFEISKVTNDKPLYFSKEDSLVKTLVQVFKDYTGIDEKPLCIGGGTYAKSMENTIAFGPVMPGQSETEHTNKEHIGINQLIDLTKIYARAIIKLTEI